jgi:DNA replication and repair protein RecF
MRIVSAAVNGFRNLQEDAFDFSPRVNVVLGRNGMGKTNLFEALNFFALGRSHQGSKTEEMIAFDGDSLHVSLEVEEDSGHRLQCEFGLDSTGGRRFRLDGEVVSRRADLVGKLATVFFNPDSINLVRGGPQNRRQFVDQGMSETDPIFLAGLAAFTRTLKQKSGLLRDMKRGLVGHTKGREELKAWNQELASHAAVICCGRQAYGHQISPFAETCHQQLTDNDSPFEFKYLPNLKSAQKSLADGLKKQSKKSEIEAEILAEFDYIIQEEIQRGRPLIGPQLDDFEVGLAGLDLRVYGSQGETRTAAVSLILARGDVLFERRKIRPVLFFDDIFSELDRERARRLQEMASQLHQVFIATARPDDIDGWKPDQVKTWQVIHGCFSEISQKP